MKIIYFFFIVPASPLTPGWFLISCWAFFLECETTLAALLEIPSISKLTWKPSTPLIFFFFPSGFVTRFLIWDRKNSGCTDICRSFTYQGWVCHVGVTTIWSIFSLRILEPVQCIKEIGDRVLMQTDPELVVLCVLHSLRKLEHLVSILNCPRRFVIWEGAFQRLQFVCWEGNSKWNSWCARVLSCVYPSFSKKMKVQPYFPSASELPY